MVYYGVYNCCWIRTTASGVSLALVPHLTAPHPKKKEKKKEKKTFFFLRGGGACISPRAVLFNAAKHDMQENLKIETNDNGQISMLFPSL